MTKSSKQKRIRRRETRLGVRIIAGDVLLLGAALVVFALFHHVLPQKLQPIRRVVSVDAVLTATPPAAAAQPAGTDPVSAARQAGAVFSPAAPTATPAPAAPGDFSASFPAKDIGAGADYCANGNDVRIAIRRVQENGVTYFAADVYVRSIEAFKTAFARGFYGKSVYDFPIRTAQDNSAVFAVTGDYYSARSKGIVIRNGTLYRSVPANDVCVLYSDGEMETYASDAFDLDAASARGAYQAWSFGPALLTQDGQPVDSFDSALRDLHPRCAIGYFEPGHYCFVVVDGRQPGYSVGMRLTELSELFFTLGCKRAYNLDGGATAVMIFRGQIINQPYKGGRESGDIIYFS